METLKFNRLSRYSQRKLLIFFGFIAFIIPSQGQLIIENGSSMVCDGTVQIVMDDLAWIQEGNFLAADSKVIFTGDLPASQVYVGGTGTTFYDIELSKSSQDLALQSSIEVVHELIFIQGKLDLNGNQVDLGNTGSLIGETEAKRAFSSQAGGLIFRMDMLNSPNMANPGSLGLTISSPANLGMTLVSRGHDPQDINGQDGILRYYDLMLGNAGAAEASIEFQYFDAELNGISEDSLELFSRLNNSMTWDPNTNANQDSIQDLFSASVFLNDTRWTLGKNVGLNVLEVEKVIAGLKIYPNPVGEMAYVEWYGVGNSNVYIELIDVAGRIVWERKYFSKEGVQTLPFETSFLPKGTYQLVIRTDNNTLIGRKRLVK
ncbi:MAG: T9SS type A sorting domain-containing protein [Bacteroidia bacterium]|nr:T9SS type A sorting domain-containing protein [Bacteroidia bacterium]